MKATHCTLFLTLLSVVFVTRGLSAQVSPEDSIRKILKTIDEELKDIDRLLLQSREKSASSGSDSKKAVQALIKETQGSQARVVRGIDQLIEELQKMSSSSSSGEGESGDQTSQERSSDPLKNQEDSQRQETENQEQRSQQGKKPGEKPGKSGDKPEPKTQPDGGNTKVGAQPAGAEERVIRERDRASWGQLPQYDFHQHIRGGLPKVPEKYRRLLEAYQKASNKTVRQKRKPRRK